MRIGLDLATRSRPRPSLIDWARAADDQGLFGIVVGGDRGAECVRAAMLSTATSTSRLIVQLRVGRDHPVTLAEEIAIVDNLSNGRVVVLADVHDLDAEAAREDVGLLQHALSNRPLRHRGPRWTIPAGLAGHDAPAAVIASPPPAQVTVPVWLTSDRRKPTGWPDVTVVVTTPSEVDPTALVQIGRDRLTGDLDDDRELVRRWAAAGATHLLVSPAPGSEPSDVSIITRHLVPEVAMVDFPTVIVSAPRPATWPGDEPSTDEPSTMEVR